MLKSGLISLGYGTNPTAEDALHVHLILTGLAGRLAAFASRGRLTDKPVNLSEDNLQKEAFIEYLSLVREDIGDFSKLSLGSMYVRELYSSGATLQLSFRGQLPSPDLNVEGWQRSYFMLSNVPHVWPLLEHSHFEGLSHSRC